jgi:hypothetical protein
VIKKVQKKKLDVNIRPISKDIVKIKEMGHITEIMYADHRNTTCKIKMLPDGKYVLLDTGEIFDIEHMENRADDKNSIRVSLGKLRDYLNTNITVVQNCRWITLTYGENMKDTKRLYKDFEKFNKRMRYHIGHYEYIVAMEPQERGAWHCHLVMIFDKKAPYIPNKKLAEIWRNGFVTVKRLDDVDNVGAYLTAYLGDMELQDAINEGVNIDGYQVKEVEIENDVGMKETKRFVKGARLNMYPPNFNLYRCSKGIKKPISEYMSEEKAEKKISAATLTFERTINLSDESTGFESTINYRYYNSKRTNSQ